MAVTDPTKSDEELLIAWSTGDKRSGAELFERHYPSLARFFANKVGPDCDDLIQVTFLGCLESLGRFRGEASFRTLLFSIARNRLMDHYRGRSRDDMRFDPTTSTIAGMNPSPVTLLGARQEHHLMLAALRRLPVQLQTILELYYWEGMKVREIAQIVDMPAGTVKTHLHRGRQQLEGEIRSLARTPEEWSTTINGLERWASELRNQLMPPTETKD